MSDSDWDDAPGGSLPQICCYRPHHTHTRSQQLTRSRGFICALKEQSSFEQDRQPPAAGKNKREKSGRERQLQGRDITVLLRLGLSLQLRLA